MELDKILQFVADTIETIDRVKKKVGDKIEEIDEESQEYYGYPLSYEFAVDNNFFGNMIDRIGGIELYENGETLRYTGIQILEKIEDSNNNPELIKEILRKAYLAIEK